uniref:Golgi SNAP receptor complex member 2 n=1 Tax=Timema douglasi TaxID=61478 RepID=A0A7R8Z4Z4_TIMDO|nr:unnamed protein product [Timema douglasi]
MSKDLFASPQRVQLVPFDPNIRPTVLVTGVGCTAKLVEYEVEERELLLNSQFTTNNSHLEGDTSILMDHSLQHNSALQNANHGVDDMLKSGAGILENLRDQRSTLKGAHRRLYDIANTLGLSNTTMRLIERRAYQDKFILLGGMLVTTFLITLIIVYLT